jgi:hypothetical protein
LAQAEVLARQMVLVLLVKTVQFFQSQQQEEEPPKPLTVVQVAQAQEEMETLAELPVQQVRVRLARAMQVVMRPAVIRVVEVEVPVLLGQQLERYPVMAVMDFRQVLLEHL